MSQQWRWDIPRWEHIEKWDIPPRGLALTSLVVAPAVSHPPPATAPAVPVLASGQPVMDAFLGVPAPVQGSAGTRRIASIARTLPGGPFSSLSNHSGPRRAFPMASSNPLVDVDVVCWPECVDKRYDPPDHPTSPIKIKNSDIKKYALRLEECKLTFQVQVPGQGRTSPAEFSRQLQAHFTAHNLTMPPFPADYDAGAPDDLDGQLWVLLQCSKQRDIYTLSEHSSINDHNFGYQEFKKFTAKFANVLPNSGGRPWAIIGCRFGHPSGPIARFATPGAPPLSGLHPCYGLRVLGSLPTPQAAHRNDPEDVDCYDGYFPAPDMASLLSNLPNTRPQTPPSQATLTRRRSQKSPSAASPARRVDQEEPQPPEDTTPPPPPVRPPLVALVRGVDFLDGLKITSWQTSVANAVRPLPEHVPLVYIHGRTVHAVAQYSVDLLLHLENLKHDPSAVFVMHDPAIQDDGIISSRDHIQLQSFFLPVRTVAIGAREVTTPTGETEHVHVTTGVGPERAALREGCQVLASRYHYWQQAAGSHMFRPILTPVDDPIQERINTFRAHGTFLALHCYLLRQGPLPISIWVLRALVEGRQSMLIPKHILLHLDPGAYDILAPWYDFHQDTPVPLPSNASHPLRQFILEYMPDIQPNLIRNSRTHQEHEAWVISAFATILFGHPSPWTRPEFLALMDGFNIWLRRLQFAERSRMLPSISPSARASDKTTGYFVKLFKIRLEHYLSGVGHPLELRRDIVSDDEFTANRYNALLRANLVLVSGTDSDLLPIEDRWQIQISGPQCNCFRSRVKHLSWLVTAMPRRRRQGSRARSPAAHSPTRTVSPPRRNPSRARRNPRRPDSPISYAAHGAIEEVPDSEEEGEDVAHASSQQQEREPSVEILNSPPGGCTEEDDDDSTVLPDRGPPELTYRQRVDLLIAEIHRLQGPTASPVLSGPAAPLVPPAVRSEDEGDTPEGASMLESTSVEAPGDTAEGGVNAVLTKTMLTSSPVEGGRTFTQKLPTSIPPDSTLIERLSTGQLGRMLNGLDRTKFFVGTSDFPVDVTGDFMNYLYRFHDLGLNGSLGALETGEDAGLATITPVPYSPIRSTLLANLGMSDHTPVYTIYIYHQDASSALESGPPAALLLTPIIHSHLPETNPTPTLATSGPPAPNLPVAVPAIESEMYVDPAVAAYLRNRFATRLQSIVRAGNASGYGTGYRHCMQEKHFMASCNMLGLDLAQRRFAPIQVNNLAISYHDVVQTAGLNKKTFATARTAVGRAREARHRLGWYFSSQNVPAVPLGDDLEVRLERVNKILKAMLGESDIDDHFLSDETGSVEAEAIKPSFERLKADTSLVLQSLTMY
ncbi:hypothetical protein DFH07DRAFT_767383 [Mycena maculata]|uniref:Uncharacterized protein n=1 Tax=Mycena maculata TaxID=230809 RepID=A0AAD7JXU6_9AGAR|nr:hypothetical protein DFH07DRAFT_767383 [Mycena maculata]